ncbi:MAG: asparagine synthase (glutamine-hydrolyzing), partial [Thermoanaerobaculia bacterium]
AAQPMTTADGRFTIVFNGEIYNHHHLREDLERDGVRFRTHSDTEVLLHLYARRKSGMLDMLRGMFAFAIWDARERRIFAARDPYGIKPFYYSTAGGTFRAASQVKALVAGGAISKETDPAGLVGFLLRGSVPEPFTTLRDVQSLPAGSWIEVSESGASKPTRYFSMAAEWRRASQSPIDPAAGAEIVRQAVVDSIRHHLVSDVPVGAFLSAGKDSTTIAAIARELGFSLKAVTLGFDEYRGKANDEVPAAVAVAQHLGIEQSIVMLTRKDFHNELPRALDAMDQPTIDGLNSYFVSLAAAAVGMKVALSGTGGDELFGGYSTFRRIPRTVRTSSPFNKVPTFARSFRTTYTALMPKHGRVSPKSAGLLEYGGTYPGAYLLRRGLFMPWELANVVGPELAHEGLVRLEILRKMEESLEPDPGTPFARVAALETTFFLRDQLLRDIDWASMAHSLEVRVPLIDVELLRAVAPIVAGGKAGGKHLLVYAPRTPLPDAIVSRPKSGFTLPLRRWLFDENPRMFGMREWALELYAAVAPLDRSVLRRRARRATMVTDSEALHHARG